MRSRASRKKSSRGSDGPLGRPAGRRRRRTSPSDRRRPRARSRAWCWPAEAPRSRARRCGCPRGGRAGSAARGRCRRRRRRGSTARCRAPRAGRRRRRRSPSSSTPRSAPVAASRSRHARVAAALRSAVAGSKLFSPVQSARNVSISGQDSSGSDFQVPRWSRKITSRSLFQPAAIRGAALEESAASGAAREVEQRVRPGCGRGRLGPGHRELGSDGRPDVRGSPARSGSRTPRRRPDRAGARSGRSGWGTVPTRRVLAGHGARSGRGRRGGAQAASMPSTPTRATSAAGPPHPAPAPPSSRSTSLVDWHPDPPSPVLHEPGSRPECCRHGRVATTDLGRGTHRTWVLLHSGNLVPGRRDRSV